MRLDQIGSDNNRRRIEVDYVRVDGVEVACNNMQRLCIVKKNPIIKNEKFLSHNILPIFFPFLLLYPFFSISFTLSVFH